MICDRLPFLAWRCSRPARDDRHYDREVELAFSHTRTSASIWIIPAWWFWLDRFSGQAAMRPRITRNVAEEQDITPHVLAITLGTTVDFPNRDFIFHNAFSNYNGETFDIGLYPPHTTKAIHLIGRAWSVYSVIFTPR